MWCWCLVLSAAAAVASGQIIFGDSTRSDTTSDDQKIFTPSRDTAPPSRGTAIPVRGTPSGTASPGTAASTPGSRACTSPEGVPGTCGPPAECPGIVRKIRQRDADYLRQAYCGRSRGQILMCCADRDTANLISSPEPSLIFTPQRPPSRPVRPTRPRPSRRPSLTPPPRPQPSRPAVPPPRTESSPGPSPFANCPRFQSPSNCGRSTFTPAKVVNGIPVEKLGDFPWMAALKYSSEPEFKCGGVVISERWILTAAHCLLSDGPTDVVLGDLNLVTDTDDSAQFPPQTIPVQLTARHPDFRRSVRGEKGITADVALIKLARDISFSDAVGPICIDSRPKAITELQEEDAYVAGWGATEFGGISSPIMQYGRVTITSPETCRASYARLGTTVDTDSQLCANGDSSSGTVDACHGDSGGPLMLRRTHNNVQRFTVAGLVSFGTGCGNPENPGVYTYVGAHVDWIGCTVNSN